MRSWPWLLEGQWCIGLTLLHALVGKPSTAFIGLWMLWHFLTSDSELIVSPLYKVETGMKYPALEDAVIRRGVFLPSFVNISDFMRRISFRRDTGKTVPLPYHHQVRNLKWMMTFQEQLPTILFWQVWAMWSAVGIRSLTVYCWRSFLWQVTRLKLVYPWL